MSGLLISTRGFSKISFGVLICDDGLACALHFQKRKNTQGLSKRVKTANGKSNSQFGTDDGSKSVFVDHFGTNREKRGEVTMNITRTNIAANEIVIPGMVTLIDKSCDFSDKMKTSVSFSTVF